MGVSVVEPDSVLRISLRVTLVSAARGAAVENLGMGSVRRSVLAPGRQPWGPADGLRVGVFVRALLGAGAVAVGYAHFWIVAAGATVGGAVGFWSEKRKQRDPSRGSCHDHSLDQ